MNDPGSPTPYPGGVVLGPNSARLRYRPVRPAKPDIDALHHLATNSHIRRYLLDGTVVDRDWCTATINASSLLFRERGVGIWFVDGIDRGHQSPPPLGFCGFHVFPELDPGPQLFYALVEGATGRGLATEIAATLVAYAIEVGFTVVRAAVDEPNRASIRVLEKVGFRRAGACPGEFGAILLFSYRSHAAAGVR